MSQLLTIHFQFEIHPTPLEKLTYEGSDIVIEFDDVSEDRIRLIFSPWQAIRVTTIDCFDVHVLLFDGRLHRRLLEWRDSEWLMALREELQRHDREATFLDHASHFVLPFQDNIVEVIAVGYEYTRCHVTASEEPHG